MTFAAAAPAPATSGAGPRGRGGAALLAVGAATVAAVLASQGDPVVSALPGLLALGAWAIACAPLRLLAAGLLLLALTVDVPQERPQSELWDTPLAGVGSLLFENLHKHVGVDALRFALVDLLVVLLGAVAVRRRMTEGAPAGGRGTPALTAALVASAGAVIFAEVYGLARGGDFKNSLWQIRTLVYVPLLALLFQETFQPRRDAALLGGVLAAAGVVKAGFAIYVYEVIARPLNMRPDYVTSHADSMLFVAVAVLAIAAWYERRTLATWAFLAGAGGLMALAMYVNNRRLAWVELAAGLATLYLVLPWSRLKRAAARRAVACIPAALLYVAAGWGSTAGVFRPVQMIRSVVDADVDRSSATRDIENFNLIWTFRRSPLLGTGFGHEYDERVVADDISHIFPQYRYIPHNSVLGVVAQMGALGFATLWLPYAVAFWLLFRSYPLAAARRERALASVCAAVLVAFLMQAWGDMGLASWECIFLAAAALGLTGKLGTSSGAWPARAAAPAAAPVEGLA